MVESFSNELRFTRLVVYNFMSFGPDEVELDLATPELSAVIGFNYDTGGESSRNGTGKSALLIDAICFALFGTNIRGINAAGLVNKMARKGQPMGVVLEFTRGPFAYQIERGENPNRLWLYRKPIDDTRDYRTRLRIDGKITSIFDQTQSKPVTNEKIIEAVGFNQTLFTYLVGLTSEAMPFMRLAASDKRKVVESLFGFTRLTEIAKFLKKDRDLAQKAVDNMEGGLAATEAANSRIHQQIDSLKQKQADYYKPFEQRKKQGELRLSEVTLAGFELAKAFEANTFVKSIPESISDRFQYVLNLQDSDEEMKVYETQKKLLDAELAAHERAQEKEFEAEISRINIKYQPIIDECNELIGPYQEAADQLRKLIDTARSKITVASSLLEQHQKTLRELDASEDQIADSKCPTCGQDLTEDHKHTQMTRLNNLIADAQENIDKQNDIINQNNAIIEEHEPDLILIEREIVAKEQERLKAQRDQSDEISAFQKKYEDQPDDQKEEILARYRELNAKHDEAQRLLADRTEAVEMAKEWKDQDAETNRLIAVIQEATENLDPKKNPDPFGDQIRSLEKNALVDIAAEKQKLADLKLEVSHLQLLIELATKPESFVRKNLIAKNLPKLNAAISRLLKQLELPHRVWFDSEMEPHISHMNSEYSDGNLSKGERTRLIVAINMAFTELFEQMNNSINLMMVDELIDSGICNRGAENAIQLLQDAVRKKNKRAFIITHRSDIRDRVDSTLTVWKENDISHIRWGNK